MYYLRMSEMETSFAIATKVGGGHIMCMRMPAVADMALEIADEAAQFGSKLIAGSTVDCGVTTDAEMLAIADWLDKQGADQVFTRAQVWQIMGRDQE